MANPSFGSTPYSPDRLIAGNKTLITREVTLTNLGATGALLRGTVLGLITANGNYGISLSAAVDGSQVARAVLADDADPTAGDIQSLIYDEGEFNETRITIGAAHTLATIREDLRAVGIHLKKPVSAV